MPSIKIKSGLSEKQIEADVATYFGWVSPTNRSPFRLIDVNESLTGADKRFDSGIPIFMQFKVSQGLTPYSLSFTRETKLNRIRKFRKIETLNDDPTLYFKLREKAANANDYQHNILKKLAESPYSHAFYVAPLSLNSKEYNDTFYDSATRYLNFPFHYRHNEIHQELYPSHIAGVPFLRNRVSIVPHVEVANADHYYSFGKSGSDIAWHSPVVLSQFGELLSYRLARIFRTAILDYHLLTPLDALPEVIIRLAGYQNDDRLSNNNTPPLRRIQAIGRRLYEEHAIGMFMVLGNRQGLAELK